MKMNNMHVIKMIALFIYSKINLVLLVSGVSTVWEYNHGCVNQYRFSLAIYLMTVLSPLYGILMDFVDNTTGNGKNVVGSINDTKTFYLKKQMKLLGKLASNNTSKIIMLPIEFKYVSIKFS